VAVRVYANPDRVFRKGKIGVANIPEPLGFATRNA
jgi:hypothetical protein